MENSWRFDHISFVVKDIDKAIKYFQSIGAVLKNGPDDLVLDLERYKFFGKTTTKPIRVKVTSLQLGPLRIDFHQPVEGNSTWQQFLDKHGEGIDHINFFVDDVKEEAAKMAAKGFPIIMSEAVGDKLLNVYLDTSKIGNVEIELSDEALMNEAIEQNKKARIDAQQAAR